MAASAAAMTMTNSANTWPSTANARLKCAKATKLTVAPLSTSSTPMRTPMALRLVAMHTAPHTNSSAPRSRYSVSSMDSGMSGPSTTLGAGQVGRADQDDQQVHGHDF